MADFTKVFDDLKSQLGTLAEQNLKEFSEQGKMDATAFLEESRGQLEKWSQLLADGQIDEDEFRVLVESLKTSAEMEALRKASAGQQKIDNFRDSALNLIVKATITAISAA